MAYVRVVAERDTLIAMAPNVLSVEEDDLFDKLHQLVVDIQIKINIPAFGS